MGSKGHAAIISLGRKSKKKKTPKRKSQELGKHLHGILELYGGFQGWFTILL